jgi:hypothetical protein
LIRFACPNCRAELKAQNDMIGSSMRCPKCRSVFEVRPGKQRRERRSWTPILTIVVLLGAICAIVAFFVVFARVNSHAGRGEIADTSQQKTPPPTKNSKLEPVQDQSVAEPKKALKFNERDILESFAWIRSQIEKVGAAQPTGNQLIQDRVKDELTQAMLSIEGKTIDWKPTVGVVTKEGVTPMPYYYPKRLSEDAMRTATQPHYIFRVTGYLHVPLQVDTQQQWVQELTYGQTMRVRGEVYKASCDSNPHAPAGLYIINIQLRRYAVAPDDAPDSALATLTSEKPLDKNAKPNLNRLTPQGNRKLTPRLLQPAYQMSERICLLDLRP